MTKRIVLSSQERDPDVPTNQSNQPTTPPRQRKKIAPRNLSVKALVVLTKMTEKMRENPPVEMMKNPRKPKKNLGKDHLASKRKRLRALGKVQGAGQLSLNPPLNVGRGLVKEDE